MPRPMTRERSKTPGGMFTETPASGAGVGDDHDAGFVLWRIGDRPNDEMAVGAAVLTHDRQHTAPAGVVRAEPGKSE